MTAAGRQPRDQGGPGGAGGPRCGFVGRWCRAGGRKTSRSGAASAPPPPPLSRRRLPAGALAAAGVPAQWTAAAALAAGRLDAPLLARSITSSAAALADINVEVPSMGESITEGTVAVILKKPGGCTLPCKAQATGCKPQLLWIVGMPPALAAQVTGEHAACWAEPR